MNLKPHWKAEKYIHSILLSCKKNLIIVISCFTEFSFVFLLSSFVDAFQYDRSYPFIPLYLIFFTDFGHNKLDEFARIAFFIKSPFLAIGIMYIFFF